MFGKKGQPPIRSLIAQGSRIEGNLRFTEGLRIDGEVVGNTSPNSDKPSILVISEAAVVEGAVLVSRLRLLPADKIRSEMTYLQIAIDKTAGPLEREAWGWLLQAVEAFHGTPR